MPDLFPPRSTNPHVRLRTPDGRCLASTGGVLSLTACEQTARLPQLWKVDGLDRADGGRFQLKVSGSGECLDLSGVDGITIGTWACGQRQPNQLFQWRERRLLARGGACLCATGDTIVASTVHAFCLSIAIVSSDPSESASGARTNPPPRRTARHRHARASFHDDAISSLSRVYEHPPPDVWQSIEQKLEAAEKWSSRSIANSLGEIENLETWTGRELQREYIQIESKSNGHGIAVVGFLVLALLLLILLLCRGILVGQCDRMLGITTALGRRRRKLHQSHIL